MTPKRFWFDDYGSQVKYVLTFNTPAVMSSNAGKMKISWGYMQSNVAAYLAVVQIQEIVHRQTAYKLLWLTELLSELVGPFTHC